MTHSGLEPPKRREDNAVMKGLRTMAILSRLGAVARRGGALHGFSTSAGPTAIFNTR